MADDIFLFGPFRLHAGERTLHAGDALLPVGGRAFDVLVGLVRRRGALAAKGELMDEVWRGQAVEENNLTTQIRNLRKILEEHDPGGRYIDTDAGRGYRFVAAIRIEEIDTPPPRPPDVGPAELPDPTRHNLPAEQNSFVGRTAELAEIEKRLLARSLVTLIGSGGVGKTRCAVRVGLALSRSLADGAWMVELAPLQDEALVAEAVCRAVGAPVSGERPPLDVATGFLRQRQMLLILDNCEHVLGGVANLAAALLRQCPQVKLLATSREKLNLPGEFVYRMPSLPLPGQGAGLTAAAAMESDAVRLFVERARDANEFFELTDDDAPAIATICRRLDGVAMATELAAARLRVMKPAEIAARLENVFRLLTGGSKAALPRQQTLRATIDWSFALLSPAERALLCRLSVFVDGFSLDGAIAVGGSGWIEADDVLDLLTALVDKSLVSADLGAAATRYRMLATTRDYACEKLADSGERGHDARLADYLADFYARGEVSWAVSPTGAWLATFAPEVENLRAAIDWAFGAGRTRQERAAPGDPARGIALVAVSGSVAEEMSLLADMKRWTALARPHLSDGTPARQAGWVLYWLTRHQSVFGVRQLSDLRRQAIDMFRAAGDAVGLSCALRTAGIAMTRPGEGSPEALAMLTEAVALVRPLGETKDLANALAHLGSHHHFHGDEAAGRRLTEEALALRVRLGDETGQIVSHINLAEFACVRGEVAVAIEHATQALEAARHSRVQEVLATVLTNYANYLLAQDDVGGARRAAMEALAIHDALGNQDYAVVCYEHLALGLALEGAHEAAARLFGYTDAYFGRTGQVRDTPEQARCDRLRAVLAASLPGEMVGRLMSEGAGWTQQQAEAGARERYRAIRGEPASAQAVQAKRLATTS